MPVSSPMPQSLPKECAKATQTFNSFASIIPQEILRGAKGFAILTIAKAGFLFSARAGSGLVIVKLANGSWSAPSAVGTGGLGVGGQAGAELSDFVIILNSKAAVQSFMSNGSINLGGNLSVAVGPIGRNAEATGSINKFATMYSYSRTRGLFGGASLEGSVIFERSDSNSKAYRDYMDDYPGEVNARMLLSGVIEPPVWAQGLISAIERRAGTLYDATWVDDQPSDHEDRRNRGYSFGSEHAAQSSNPSSPVGNAKLRKSRRSDNAQEDNQFGDEENQNRWDGYEETARNPAITSSKDRMSVMANQFQGRLRGYSLGSFGKGKSGSGGSGSSTPAKKTARERSYSTATPRTRFEENDDYIDDDYNGYRTSSQPRTRGFSDTLDEAPPPSLTSSTSKVSKLTELMKRPVMPTRKSTSSVQTMAKSSRDSPSRWKPNASTKKEKNRLQYAGNYETDEDRYGRDDFTSSRSKDNRSGGRTADSPFGDQVNQVEHRFSSEHEDGDSVYGYRNTGREKNESKSRFMPKMVRPKTQRSSTAPAQNNGYKPYNDTEHNNDEEIDYDDIIQFGRNGNGNRPHKTNVYAFSEQFDENTARQSFDSLDQQPIAIFKHTVESDNPFDESTSAAPSHSKRDNEFFSAKESSDLLSTLDEEIPLSSSYSDVERPTHRLDSRQFNRNKNGNNGRNAAEYQDDYDHDNDIDSIRSIDSAKEYMFVGQKAHKVPLKVRQVDNDYTTSPTEIYQSDKSPFPREKEWRIATFDFEGGQAADLSFKTGDIIEVLAKDDPDWWSGRIGTKQGIIPVNRTRPHVGQ